MFDSSAPATDINRDSERLFNRRRNITRATGFNSDTLADHFSRLAAHHYYVDAGKSSIR